MQIIYSQHIENRLRLRRIEYDLPKTVFEQATERYFDNETRYYIAVGRAVLYNKVRDIMVAYDIVGENVTLLTIHPLKKGQKENRIESGRWREMK